MLSLFPFCDERNLTRKDDQVSVDCTVAEMAAATRFDLIVGKMQLRLFFYNPYSVLGCDALIAVEFTVTTGYSGAVLRAGAFVDKRLVVAWVLSI